MRPAPPCARRPWTPAPTSSGHRPRSQRIAAGGGGLAPPPRAPPPAPDNAQGLAHRLLGGLLAGLALVSGCTDAAGATGLAPPDDAAPTARVAQAPASAARPGPPATPAPAPAPALDYAAAASARAAARHHALPSSPAAAALASFDRAAYTDDGWAAAQTIAAYAVYVDSLAGAEAAPGCEACEANRAALERVWQTVSREFYSPGPAGGGAPAFSQAAWASQLERALGDAPGHGLLRTRRDLHAAAAAMVASLGDRYTAFLPGPAFRAALRRPTAGELPYLAAQVGGGPGLVLATDGDGAGGVASPSAPPAAHAHAHARGGGVRIAAVAAESAAEGAGIRPGDTLLEADFYRLDRLAPSDARALLRGPAGSSLTVTILPSSSSEGARARPAGPDARRRRPKPVTLTLERAAIPQPPAKVDWSLATPAGRPVGYVRLHYFAREATDALAAALIAGEARGVGGWVVDVRANPGGVFEEGVASAALFLPAGTPIARTERSGGGGSGTDFVAGGLSRSDYPATAAGALTAAPVAVLADEGSASAAEVFAGALTGGGGRGVGRVGPYASTSAAHPPRAALVSAAPRTFGKGLVQYYFPISLDPKGDGADGGLKVTVAKYLSPAASAGAGAPGSAWVDVQADHGLAPTLRCAPVPGRDDVGHAGPGAPDPATDGCLAAALRFLDGAGPAARGRGL